jgi:hypothetical protein
VSPLFFWLLAVVALLLLSVAIAPRVRRRPAINLMGRTKESIAE